MNKFVLKLISNTLGLAVASEVFNLIDYDGRLLVLIIGGLLLAIVNSIIRPILIFLSFPVVLLTLGLFIIIINSLMVLLVGKLYPSLQIDDFSSAFWTAMIVSIINIIMANFSEGDDKK